MRERNLFRARGNGTTRRAVGLFWIDRVDLLANAPTAGCTRPAHKREIARGRIEKIQTVEVVGAIVGLDINPFRRAPDELPGIIRALHILTDSLLPGLVADSRKF